MQDLNFRKKRRRQARRKKKMKKQGLRFETNRPGLRFQKEQVRGHLKKAATAANWAFQIAVVCVIAFVLVWFFGQRVSNAGYSIKRIVGLPGETVQIKDGSVYINDVETLEHIFAEDIEEAGIADEPVVLKGNEYFVLGDNHSSSDDSRMADIGNVKRREIYGKVWFVASFGSDFGFVKR